MTKSLILAIALAASPLASVTADAQEVQNSQNTSYVPFATDSIGRAPSDEHCSVELAVDFPSASGQLADSVRSYIAEELKSFYPQQDDGTTNPAEYKGDIVDGKALVGFHAESILKDLQKSYATWTKNGEPQDMYLMTQASIHKASENDSIVTYESGCYTFQGGAHGSYWQEGVTFRRSDGSRIDIELDPLLIDSLQPMLRDGVNKYLHDNSSGITVESLMDGGLFLADRTIPLPSTPVYLTADGVKFVYQQYEIGPYAIGLPTFTIPLDKLRPYILKSE